MTALELFAFIFPSDEQKNIEWRDNKLILWLKSDEVIAFSNLAVDYLKDNRAIPVSLVQKGLIALELNDACEYYGIHPGTIVKK